VPIKHKEDEQSRPETPEECSHSKTYTNCIPV
jgi:hypothetical protein